MSEDAKMPLQDELRIRGIYYHGYGILPKFVMCDTDLPLVAKAIYAFICSFSGKEGTAFPRRDTILSRLNISKQTYYNHLNILKEQGYISVQRQTNERGVYTHNIYFIEMNPKKFTEKQVAVESGGSTLSHQDIKGAGYGAISKTVMMDERLHIKAKGIYAYFVSFAGAGKVAFPEVKTILYHLNLTETTYRKHLKSLLDANYIIIKQRHQNGRLGVNDYYLIDKPDDSTIVPKRRSKPTPNNGFRKASEQGRGAAAQEGIQSVISQSTDGVLQSVRNQDMDESLAAQAVPRIDELQSVKKQDMGLQDVGKQDEEEQDMEKQDVEEQDEEKQDMRKSDTNINSPLNISSTSINSSHNQSINPAQPQTTVEEMIDGLNETELKEVILKKIGIYDELFGGAAPSQQALEIQKLVSLVVNTITVKEATIHIARADRARQEVVETLFGLTKEHYIYVLESLRKVTKQIQNPIQYQLTALYNAPTTYKPKDEVSSYAWIRKYIKMRDKDQGGEQK